MNQLCRTEQGERKQTYMKRTTERSNRVFEEVGDNQAWQSAENGPASIGARPERKLGRRLFMKSLALGGASLMPIGAALADGDSGRTRLGSIADGDAANLRFLAAAVILETDLWQQYTD